MARPDYPSMRGVVGRSTRLVKHLNPPVVDVSGDLGINPNFNPSSTWLTRLASLNPSWVRIENFDSGYTWAVANGVAVYGLLNNVESNGVTSLVNKVKAYPSVQWWELDNEPYFRSVTVTTWAASMLSLAQQIKAWDPTKKLMLPMLCQVNGGDYLTSGSWTPWATQVFNAQPSLVNYIDAWSAHPYESGFTAPGSNGSSGSSGSGLACLNKVRTQLTDRGINLPCWVSEIGWPTSAVSYANQATYMSSFVTTVRGYGWVDNINWYCLQDFGATGQENTFGLWSNTGVEKNAAATFRSLV